VHCDIINEPPDAMINDESNDTCCELALISHSESDNVPESLSQRKDQKTEVPEFRPWESTRELSVRDPVVTDINPGPPASEADDTTGFSAVFSSLAITISRSSTGTSISSAAAPPGNTVTGQTVFAGACITASERVRQAVVSVWPQSVSLLPSAET
jgi:hypothetical protein